jgi:hypothetical protein
MGIARSTFYAAPAEAHIATASSTTGSSATMPSAYTRPGSLTQMR